MQKNELSFLSSNNKTNIHVIEWVPDGLVKGVVQLCHGMVEYIDRYDDFARFLAGNGYYVVGNDHLGHGASVDDDSEHGFFGHPHGNDFLIWDIHLLRKVTQKKYPNVPYFMLGHSMGSFLLRQYITEFGEGIDGAVIMGTGYQPAGVLTSGRAMCKAIAKIRGWNYRSNKVNEMALGAYNKEFEPARTRADWLTRDETIVDKYIADPWCSYTFTVNGYYQMFKGIQAAQRKGYIDSIPKEMPLFLVSGQNDPVGEFGKGVRKVYEAYKDAGIFDVKMKLYEADRHEILNELDKESVYEDILDFFDAHLK